MPPQLCVCGTTLGKACKSSSSISFDKNQHNERENVLSSSTSSIRTSIAAGDQVSSDIHSDDDYERDLAFFDQALPLFLVCLLLSLRLCNIFDCWTKRRKECQSPRPRAHV